MDVVTEIKRKPVKPMKIQKTVRVRLDHVRAVEKQSIPMGLSFSDVVAQLVEGYLTHENLHRKGHKA